VSARSWAGLPPLGWFLAGLAGSALVASLVGIPPGEAGSLLAVITLAAMVVVAAGLGLQRRLRKRRAKVARQGALTAAVTAAVALAGLWAVSAQMLVSSHDLAVVLASLPVAAGAGVAYGVATARQVAADLEALAGVAKRLEAGDLAARARVQGTAEVALIAETLNAAAARLAGARERERRMEQGRRDLIAWASHDLRTPLASLRALAEALADDMAPDEATRRRYLAGLTANVERLSALVDDLFELSAIQAGAVALQLEPTSLPRPGRRGPGPVRTGSGRERRPAREPAGRWPAGAGRPRPARPGAGQPGRQRHSAHAPWGLPACDRQRR
jgi:signal transduction histidine kinase